MKKDRAQVKIIKKRYPLLSNSIIQKLIDSNSVNDKLEINIEDLRTVLFNSSYYPNAPEEKKLNILFEDTDTLVINKESGVAIEQLVGYVTWYINKESLNPMDIPRPVHRLDKDTKGIILFSKNLPSHNYYSKLFKQHDLNKYYVAYVEGNIEETIKNFPHKIESYISDKPYNRKYYSTDNDKGKLATTIINNSEYDVKNNISKLNIEILTGRTHQIRVHLSELGYPVIGDSIYGKNSENGLQLCASHLVIKSFKGEVIDLVISY